VRASTYHPTTSLGLVEQRLATSQSAGSPTSPAGSCCCHIRCTRMGGEAPNSVACRRMILQQTTKSAALRFAESFRSHGLATVEQGGTGRALFAHSNTCCAFVALNQTECAACIQSWQNASPSAALHPAPRAANSASGWCEGGLTSPKGADRLPARIAPPYPRPSPTGSGCHAEAPACGAAPPTAQTCKIDQWFEINNVWPRQG
jgi:hypothetical protein